MLSVLFLKHPSPKRFIIILGLTGYFFYGYGLYAMQGQYTSIYLIYLIIFGLSLYSLIFGLLSFEPEAVNSYQLPGGLRKSIVIFLIVILVVLVPLWILFLSIDIANHVARDTYGVFVLDLCVVFPALGLIVSQLLRNKPFGNILAGVALLKTVTLCLSVAFGEWFGPLYGGFQPNIINITIFSILTVVSLLLSILYLINLKKDVSING